MKKAFWFDMDGTLADLYGVENWEYKLRHNDPSPYICARPLLSMTSLARLLHKVQRRGYKIGIISWTSRGGTEEYNEQVKQAKLSWLAKHLKSVNFDYLDIVEYGTPKEDNRSGFLFDDDERNRKQWGYDALSEKGIIKKLKEI